MDTFDNYGRAQDMGPGIEPSREQSVYSAAPEAHNPSQPQQSPSSYTPPMPVSGCHSENPEPVYTAHEPEPYRYVPHRAQEQRSRRSPFADSPYVVNPYREEPTFHYQAQTVPQEAPKKSRKKRSGAWRVILAAALTVALVVGGCLITAGSVNSKWQTQHQQSMAAMNQRIAQLEEQLQQLPDSSSTPASSAPATPAAAGTGLTPAQVYQQNVKSVVAISVSIQTQAYGQTIEGASAGSGFILTEDGYVVTNYHVVEGATAVSVVMSDGTEMAAKVVGYDATNDVAVLKVEATGLPAVKLGSSNALTVGDMVVAIGNPLGELNSTQTVGYICGKDREITTGGTIINMLQTDAAINPGNSGGPLFNMRGEVVGITTAKYSGTTSSGASIEGIGFAIPIDDIVGIISDLQTFGYVTGAYLGVVVQNVDVAFTEAYGISGATVISVEPGYAAARAGIQPKDIIVALNGTEVGSITDLTRALRAYKAGDTVTITLIRNGVKTDVTVTLDEKPQNLQQPSAVPEEEMPEGNYEEWYEYFRRYFGE